MTHTLREKAMKATETMRAYDAWEPTAPPPSDPIDYAGTADTLTALLDRIEKLEGALRPFAGEKLPSLKRSIIDYDRNGLRRSMSPMEVAARNASQALSEPS